MTAVTRRKFAPGDEFEIDVKETGRRFVNVETGEAFVSDDRGVLKIELPKGYAVLAADPDV